MTAAERRAAGEAEFYDCATCVFGARSDLGALTTRAFYTDKHEQGRIAALLRALVVQALLDPATWARPKGWWRS